MLSTARASTGDILCKCQRDDLDAYRGIVLRNAVKETVFPRAARRALTRFQ
jgi:hypothetical protein